MKRLVIVGAGGHGKVVADAAEAMRKWSEIVFVDTKYPHLKSCSHWSVVGNDGCLDRLACDAEFIVAIGSNAIRGSVHSTLVSKGLKIATIIHPRSYVSAYCQIGSGSVVFAGAVINVDCRIGEATIINTGATVDHDCIIGDSTHISPGAHLAGEVSVGVGTWIGIGASVIQQINIGDRVTVGAGAIVVSDISDGVTAVGIPAKPIKG